MKFWLVVWKQSFTSWSVVGIIPRTTIHHNWNEEISELPLEPPQPTWVSLIRSSGSETQVVSNPHHGEVSGCGSHRQIIPYQTATTARAGPASWQPANLSEPTADYTSFPHIKPDSTIPAGIVCEGTGNSQNLLPPSSSSYSPSDKNKFVHTYKKDYGMIPTCFKSFTVITSSSTFWLRKLIPSSTIEAYWNSSCIEKGGYFPVRRSTLD